MTTDQRDTDDTLVPSCPTVMVSCMPGPCQALAAAALYPSHLAENLGCPVHEPRRIELPALAGSVWAA